MKKSISVEILHTIEKRTTESRKEWMIRIFKAFGIVNSNNKIPVMATR